MVPGASDGLFAEHTFLLGFPMPISDRSVFLRYSKIVSVTSRTAVYGPVRTVVWQGSAGDRRPYADHCIVSVTIFVTVDRPCHRFHVRNMLPRFPISFVTGSRHS